MAPETSIVVEPVAFVGPNTHGDYGWQLEQPEYDRVLHIYNENVSQQRDKASTSRGGGNAVARPYRSLGKAIGIPTGQGGQGFSSLEESIGTGGETAKDVIDEAIKYYRPNCMLSSLR